MPRAEALGFLMGIGLPAPLSFRPTLQQAGDFVHHRFIYW